MSWARLDDSFYRNGKQLKMTDAAFRLYVCALSYCAEDRDPTGYMTSEQADGLRRALRVPPRAVQELASLNAWEPIDGGYLVHDYDQYLEKGSRDRVRKHREVKRGGNVTETPDGNVTETFLARDGYPIPKPVPVESPPSSGTPKAPSYLPQREDVRSEQVPTVTTVSPPTLGFRAVELLQGFGELMGRTHSATEAIKAQEFCTELTYLSPAEMLERMRSHLAWCDEHQAHRPNSLAGFWSSLRTENDRRRDLGGRPADPGPGALGGLLL